MNLIIALLITSLLLFGDNSKPADKPKPKESFLLDLDYLKLQNISLRAEVLRLQTQALETEQQQLVEGVCKASGIDLTECRIDPKERTVKAVKPPPPPEKK